jgi:hypothetical protein
VGCAARESDQGGVRFHKSSVTIFSIAAFVRGGFGLCRRCVLLGSSITPHLVLPMWHNDLVQRPSQQVSVVVRHPSLKSDTRLVVCSRLRYYFGCCSHHHSSRSNTRPCNVSSSLAFAARWQPFLTNLVKVPELTGAPRTNQRN